MNELVFTDIKLLETIQKEYASDFIKSMNEHNAGKDNTVFYIPIDCNMIAKKLNVNAEMVFNKLYFYLNNKYSYKANDNTTVNLYIHNFSKFKKCINYPYLCSILADLKDKRNRENWSFVLSVIAITVSIVGLLI